MYLTKKNKAIGLLRKLSNLLPRQALVIIYKAFVRPHLDYGDVLYDQAFNNSFHAKMESIQYNACLTITGAIRGSSREKIYQELGLESIQLRRWYRTLCLFYKVFKNEHPKYFFHLIPVKSTPYATRTVGNIPLIKGKHNFFKNSFFPSAIIEWNNLDPNLRNSKSISVLKEKTLNLIFTILSLDSKLLDCTDYDLAQTLLFGNTSQTSSNNFKIISALIDCILSSKRFDCFK